MRAPGARSPEWSHRGARPRGHSPLEPPSRDDAHVGDTRGRCRRRRLPSARPRQSLHRWWERLSHRELGQSYSHGVGADLSSRRSPASATRPGAERASSDRPMKLALIGHASWLVDTPNTRILFDPLLFDPNQGDCYEVHPSRRVHVPELADVDVVVVSHRHIDHFDMRSLCSLPKTAAVLCPRDPLIVKTLEAIGFGKVRAVEDWDRGRRGASTIVATPSRNPVPEHGFVVSDGRHTIWNQVDTQVAPETTTELSRTYGRLDVLIAPWQPLLELKFQLNESTSFPHQAYADLIRQASGSAAEGLDSRP